MKFTSIAAIQKRDLNQRNKIPFAIQSGFEAPPALRCEFVIAKKNGPKKLCNRSVRKNSSYCPVHHRLCFRNPHKTRPANSMDESKVKVEMAQKDFEADAAREDLATLQTYSLLP